MILTAAAGFRCPCCRDHRVACGCEPALGVRAMRALIQRASHARVEVDGEVVGEIRGRSAGLVLRYARR